MYKLFLAAMSVCWILLAAATAGKSENYHQAAVDLGCALVFAILAHGFPLDDDTTEKVDHSTVPKLGNRVP
jgi:hypothetical protein